MSEWIAEQVLGIPVPQKVSPQIQEQTREAVKETSRNSERMAEPIVDIHAPQMTAALAQVPQMKEKPGTFHNNELLNGWQRRPFPWRMRHQHQRSSWKKSLKAVKVLLRDVQEEFMDSLPCYRSGKWWFKRRRVFVMMHSVGQTDEAPMREFLAPSVMDKPLAFTQRPQASHPYRSRCAEPRTSLIFRKLQIRKRCKLRR